MAAHRLVKSANDGPASEIKDGLTTESTEDTEKDFVIGAFSEILSWWALDCIGCSWLSVDPCLSLGPRCSLWFILGSMGAGDRLSRKITPRDLTNKLIRHA